MKHKFEVIVEKDAEGYFIASVSGLPGCHTQAKSLDELMVRIREAIALCLEVEGAPLPYGGTAVKPQKSQQSLRTHPAFGSWRNRGIDAVAYQQNLRNETEWTDYTKEREKWLGDPDLKDFVAAIKHSEK